jgi:CheY-like chemotaxis protein
MSARILIVDDDAAIRRTLAEALGEEPETEVEVASSAEEALRVLATEPSPDVVLSDLRMRGLDGMDLLRLLRQRAPSSRVVLMTAYHDVGTAVGAMREGASDFLCKPFDLSTVRDVLHRLLGSSHGPASLRRASVVTLESHHTASGLRPARVLLAGRYAVEAEIGHGAMASVVSARDVRHDRRVAIKVLRREVAAAIGADRFLREIRLTASLHHPHILTLIDSGEWDGVPFFVTPLVDGPSLRRRLQDGAPMTIIEAAALLRDVSDALAAAHALGIVHRDVKPENVLLSGRHAWVADFGVARVLWDAVQANSTTPGTAVGTPHYMAPEQGLGEEMDHRADIYALGVLAYELLTGRPPFTGPTLRAVLAAHVAAEPAPLRALCPGIEEGLEQTVMRCLNKAPGDRWPDAEVLSQRFARYAVEVGQ